ncbi:MAG: hypothetical protein K9G60_03275 [Pseudolabrys sp.]|nr:hypothetical protein [Pseudolabrys sp.]
MASAISSEKHFGKRRRGAVNLPGSEFGAGAMRAAMLAERLIERKFKAVVMIGCHGGAFLNRDKHALWYHNAYFATSRLLTP